MVKSVFDLDMTPGRMLPLIINVSQYDDIGRTIVFNLYSSVGAWTAPTSASATFEGGKPDGKFFAYNCAYSSGTVTVTIQQQMTAVAGKVRCKIKVVSGDKVVESAPIIMVVDAAAVPDGSDMSKSDINDAIANATQKIVDQVKDNIPSDYSQLSTDVSSLKEDIANTKYQLSESIVEISDDVKNIITKTPTEEKTDVEATEIINGSIILSSGNLSKNQYTARFVVNRYDNVNRGKYEVHGYAQGNQCLYVVKKGDEVKTYQKVGDTIDAAGTKTLDLTIEEDGCTVYVGAYETVAGWLKKYGEKKTLNGHIEVPQIDIAKITKSNLYGKKVTLNGDSIAYGQGTGGTGFMDYIAEKYSMTLDKKAVSGGTIADLSKRYPDKHCICNTVSDMAKDADYVIFEGGYNDWYLWTQIGAITDTMSADLDTSKFYGALESICRQALEIWKGKKIGFVITHKINDAWRTQKQEGSTYPTLNGYYQAIHEVCEKYSIPYLDLSRVSRFNTELADYKLYTYNLDGIHPIKEGYGNFYVPLIERWMEQL